MNSWTLREIVLRTTNRVVNNLRPDG